MIRPILCTLIFLLLFQKEASGQIEISETDRIDLISLISEKYANQDLKVYQSNTFVVALKNSSGSPIIGYISLQKPYFKAKNWYVNNKLVKSESHQVLLDIPPNQNCIIRFTLPELDRLNPNGFDLSFIKLETYTKDQSLIRISQPFFIGVFLFLGVFNFLLYLTTRWSVYLKYSIYIVLTSFYFFYYFGFLPHLVPAVDDISINIIASLYSIIFIAYFIFIQELGNYKAKNPKAFFYLKVGILYKSIQVVLEVILYSYLTPLLFSPFYKYTFLIFEIILMIMIIYHVVRAKDFRGKVVIYGSLILIISAILAQLNLNINRALLLETGMLLEMVLFSVSLGYISRIDGIEKIKNQSLYVEQLELNQEILRKHERELESKIQKRTNELKLEKKSVEDRNKENEVLLKEIHHRVKNNLQMIISLLNMQQRRVKDKASIESLIQTKNKVKTIGLIHEHLYKHDDFSNINLKKYTEDLCQILIGSMNKGLKSIETTIEVEDLMADMETAIPVGLILNELITNSIKYAFNDVKEPVLKINIMEDENKLLLIVFDNGKGISESAKSEGFGNTIIEALLDNLDGEVQYMQNANGFQVKVCLKEFLVSSSKGQ